MTRRATAQNHWHCHICAVITGADSAHSSKQCPRTRLMTRRATSLNYWHRHIGAVISGADSVLPSKRCPLTRLMTRRASAPNYWHRHICAVISGADSAHSSKRCPLPAPHDTAGYFTELLAPPHRRRHFRRGFCPSIKAMPPHAPHDTAATALNYWHCHFSAVIVASIPYTLPYVE